MKLYHLAAGLSMAASVFHQVAALSHGEIDDWNGQPIHWQQLANGIFTGVPSDEWDDKLNVIVNEEWDLDEIMSMDLSSGNNTLDVDSHHLNDRDLSDICSTGWACVKYGFQWTLLQGFNAWLGAAEYASNNAKKDLIQFLNQPFVANAGGVAIAGIISGQVNAGTASECSTEGSEKDVIAAVVHAALAENPDAEDVTVDIKGPGGEWSITVNAGPSGEKPPTTCDA